MNIGSMLSVHGRLIIIILPYISRIGFYYANEDKAIHVLPHTNMNSLVVHGIQTSITRQSERDSFD